MMPSPFTLPAPTAAALPRQRRAYRTVFLSDLHLGTSRGQPRRVLDFLHHAQAETLFLVGDIFDGWNPAARRSAPLPDHRLLLDRLDHMAADGQRVVLVPGNHDSAFRRYAGQHLGPMEVHEETHHDLADGRRFLVTHGDSVDPLMAFGETVGWAGGQLDVILRRMNRGVNALIAALGGTPSDLVENLLIQINGMMHPRATYATRLTDRARGFGHDGVICGHYHLPAMTQLGGTTYANCGDWLDHFSAVTETATGALQLVHWPDPVTRSQPRRARLPLGGLPAG
jgi:UDP-2,3-diacylglucosamine pyrophosphatase LpxH